MATCLTLINIHKPLNKHINHSNTFESNCLYSTSLKLSSYRSKNWNLCWWLLHILGTS